MARVIYLYLVLFCIIISSFGNDVPTGLPPDLFRKQSGPLIINRGDSNFDHFSSSFGGRTKRSEPADGSDTSSLFSRMETTSKPKSSIDTTNSNITAKVCVKK